MLTSFISFLILFWMFFSLCILPKVLFHKLSEISLNYGIREAQVFGRHWLLSALVQLYKSAQNQDSFSPADRILDFNGSSLLQCDALRPSDGCYHPSMDARASASANMYNMNPSSLARCVAPRLELWYYESVESVGMSLSSLVCASRELSIGRNLGVPIIFLDSPSQIFLSYNFLEGLRSSKPIHQVPKKYLNDAVNEAVLSYRVSPPVNFCFENADASLSSPYILDVLIEDSHDALFGRNFREWCMDIAEIVNGKWRLSSYLI